MSFVVGLTGGIGSGKSAAAECFGELGARIIDTDAIARRITAADGVAMPAILAAFGPSVVATDGALDRVAMRRRAFNDPATRQQLESILHPLIRKLCLEVLHAPAPGHGYTVLVIPLLVETGAYRDHLQRIAVVDCPESLQITRVMARSGLAQAEVEAILAAQAARAARRAVANDVIDNTGSLAELQAQVARLHEQYVRYAANCRTN